MIGAGRGNFSVTEQAKGTSISRKGALMSVFWSGLENGGMSIISFFSLIIYARFLEPSDFGLYAVTLSLVEVLGLLANMTFHDALVQREQVDDIHFDTAFVASLTIGVALIGLCWLVAPLFAHLIGDPRGAAVLRVLSFGFLVSSASSTIVARDRREFKFKLLAMRSLTGRLGGAAIGLVAALFGLRVWSLVIQQVAMLVLGSTVLWITATRRPRPRLDRGVLVELSKFAAPALGGLFTNFAVKRVLTFSAGVFLGVNIAGYINVAFRTVDTFWSVMATAVNQVSLPILARLQNDPPKLRAAYERAVSFACTLLYPMFVGLAVVAPEITRVLFGARWLASAPYTAMLGFLTLLQAPRLFVPPMLTAAGRPGDVFKGYLSGLLFLVAAIAVTRFATPTIVVTVWVLCEVVYSATFARLLMRGTGIGPRHQFRAVRTPFVAVLAMAALCEALRYLVPLPPHLPTVAALMGYVVIGGIAYLGTYALLDRRTLTDNLSFVTAWRKRK